MKHSRTLALLIAAGAALMALAGTASATEITSSTGSTPTIHATTEGDVTFHGNLFDTTCTHSTFQMNVESHGPGVTAKGNVSALTFSGCDNHVTVKKTGSLEIHPVSPTGNGTLTSSGAEISILNTPLNVTCVYTTASIHLGTLTTTIGEHATLHVDSGLIPRTGGSAFCGSTGEWTGSYQITHPTDLEVHAS